VHLVCTGVDEARELPRREVSRAPSFDEGGSEFSVQRVGPFSSIQVRAGSGNVSPIQDSQVAARAIMPYFLTAATASETACSIGPSTGHSYGWLPQRTNECTRSGAYSPIANPRRDRAGSARPRRARRQRGPSHLVRPSTRWLRVGRHPGNAPVRRSAVRLHFRLARESGLEVNDRRSMWRFRLARLGNFDHSLTPKSFRAGASLHRLIDTRSRWHGCWLKLPLDPQTPLQPPRSSPTSARLAPPCPLNRQAMAPDRPLHRALSPPVNSITIVRRICQGGSRPPFSATSALVPRPSALVPRPS
jgi:hypothetical protein